MRVKQVSTWLISRKLLPETTRIRLAIERSDETSTYCYSSEQVAAMVSLCRCEADLGWLASLIVFLASTGARIGEAVALRWVDVDLNAGFVRIVDNRHSAIAQKSRAVRTTKGGRSRQIPIHPTLHHELSRISRRADGRVFSGYRGGIADPDRVRDQFITHVIVSLKKRWPTAEGEIGFEHGRIHSFRHYFVSQAFVGGASEGEIRDWVGHRDSRIVERYRHLNDADSQRKMNQLQLLHGDTDMNRKPSKS